ncbi:MAG: hypothetical protein Terrestrivirus1_147 [Terrestrivirus sp.]|uniref:Uncharacterized protein n=1 Tax=Terrestrivirus sp. TaxID=2487775 RepID=A0A3G4ZNU0_9VIRU|nr:MAG: hypothetical protein Terrestrivirus1_147 [Terrestrivirus sp.]
MVKTVIQVWTHIVKNLQTDTYNNFWGLGDIIRGTIKLHQLSKKLGFELLVDIQHHPVSAYLKPQMHKYYDLIKQNKYNIEFVFPNNTEQYINNNSDNTDDPDNVIYFITNDGYRTIEEPLTEECKNFMKNILTPNEEFEKYLTEMTQTISHTDYNILHYRLGDDSLVRNVQNSFPELKDSVIKNMEENDILMSDNALFKSEIQKELPVFIFNIIPTHMGYTGDESLIKDSLFEFFVISGATKIKTHSVYTHISGFVYWSHMIYDIPLHKI